ncbi:hypothetical protein QUF72_11455, partial [Desulfobacterales bacterium HSG2]|nr:hypothetical protein [Desulfobacterales bacterium HSG2]
MEAADTIAAFRLLQLSASESKCLFPRHSCTPQASERPMEIAAFRLLQLSASEFIPRRHVCSRD